jgi:hypothetical protein
MVVGRPCFANDNDGDCEMGDSLQLQWFKRPDAEWCLLANADRMEIDIIGVFIVWRPGDVGRTSAVLYIGHGALRQKIAECQRDPVMAGATGLRITSAIS